MAAASTTFDAPVAHRRSARCAAVSAAPETRLRRVANRGAKIARGLFMPLAVALCAGSELSMNNPGQ